MTLTGTTPTDAAGSAEPTALLRRWPELRRVPRVGFCTFPTPLEDAGGLAPGLWLKRDDLSAPALGGNKPRALEHLLAGIRAGEEIVTVGGRGSTHTLAVAVYGALLGGRVSVFRWTQEMNPVAHRVEREIVARAAEVRDVWTPVGAMARAGFRRLRGARWIPAGGTSPLGILGHVNAGLELAEQVAAGAMPRPRRVILPLGSGGTTAGIALGFAAAGLDAEILAVQVVPRIVANRARVLRLARRTARLIERSTGTPLPRVDAGRIVIHRAEYGGAYGRPTRSAVAAADVYAAWSGRTLDITYGGKALAAALALANGEPAVFWLTFDARFADSHPEPS